MPDSPSFASWCGGEFNPGLTLGRPGCALHPRRVWMGGWSVCKLCMGGASTGWGQGSQKSHTTRHHPCQPQLSPLPLPSSGALRSHQFLAVWL